MDKYRILKAQPISKFPEHELIKLVYAVTGHMLNNISINEVLSLVGVLLNTYHIDYTPKDLKPLKRNYTNDEIMYLLANVIENKRGYENSLLPLLRAVL